jgi:hypothetical protein
LWIDGPLTLARKLKQAMWELNDERVLALDLALKQSVEEMGLGLALLMWAPPWVSTWMVVHVLLLPQ